MSPKSPQTVAEWEARLREAREAQLRETELRKRARLPGEPWDSFRYGMPDPELPPAERLIWYEVFTRTLMASMTIFDGDRRVAVDTADRVLVARERAA